MKKSWKYPGKISESHEKITEKSWKIHGKIRENSQKNHEKLAKN